MTYIEKNGQKEKNGEGLEENKGKSMAEVGEEDTQVEEMDTEVGEGDVGGRMLNYSLMYLLVLRGMLKKRMNKLLKKMIVTLKRVNMGVMMITQCFPSLMVLWKKGNLSTEKKGTLTKQMKGILSKEVQGNLSKTGKEKKSKGKKNLKLQMWNKMWLMNQTITLMLLTVYTLRMMKEAKNMSDFQSSMRKQT